MNMECFKDTPKSVKMAYALIALLFVLNVFSLTKIEKKVVVAPSTTTKLSNAEIEDWIKANPEIMFNSINKYLMEQQQKIMEERQAKSKDVIKSVTKDLKISKYDGVLNPKGTVELVEFYDYNCHYCKVAFKNVEKLLETRKDVKVILKTIPILGPASKYATQVGMAIKISNPEKYETFYKEIMKGSARSKDGVAKAVKATGLKMSKIESVLSKNKDEIEKAINANLELANKIGINGTPAFVINEELIPGAVDTDTLNKKLVK